jgi:alpha 1,2-mannosyltransferase
MLLAACSQRVSAALLILCGVSIFLSLLSVLNVRQASSVWPSKTTIDYHEYTPHETYEQPSSERPPVAKAQDQSPLSNFEVTEILSPLLDQYKPDTPELKNNGSAIAFWPPKNKHEPLLDKLDIPPSAVTKLREAHRGFVRSISTQVPPYTPHSQPESRGIVTVAGGAYFAVLMVTLRMLRRSGSTLPVEVFIPTDDDYEYEVCEQVLPSMNAKCIVLTDIMRSPNSTYEPEKKLERFQFKLFSMLFSSFDNVLWLDTDSVPLHDPSPLFESEPFLATGMLTWPDLWTTTVSPAYYIIADSNVTSVSSRASTESGQLLVSKRTHYHTLLLAAYYNYHGPSHYYAMLCQGNAGIGDKETFLPAAEALGNPYYNVRTKPAGVGHINPKNNDLHKFALLQHDPVEDLALSRQEQAIVEDHDVGKAAGLPPNGAVVSKPRPFFLHASLPKWNAKNVLTKAQPHSLIYDRKGVRSAGFRDPPEAAASIKGVERMMWEETRWVACEMNVTLKEWKQAVTKEGRDFCAELKEHFEKVLDSPIGAKLGLGSVILDLA